MQALIFDYGATIDSGGKHWAEVLWEGFCQVSLPVTKEQFREAYIFSERYIALTPVILPSYNFFELMQTRIGIEIDFMVQQGWLTEDIMHRTLRLFSEDNIPILDDIHEMSEYFTNRIAGYCYDYARRCTLDIIPVLERVSQTYDCALVSNFYGNLESVLSDFGLSTYFRCVVDSALVGVSKPDPKIFQIAIDKLGYKPENTTVIGDSFEKDIQPAIKLGCKAIWLKGSGWDSAADDAVKFDNVVTSIYELQDQLLK